MKLPLSARTTASILCLSGMLSLNTRAQLLPNRPNTHPSPVVETATPVQGGIPTANSAAFPGPQGPQQRSDASISGIVADASGAVIPGARIDLKSDSSKTQRSAAANNEGGFRFAGLEPGIYTVTIGSKGFATWNSGEIALSSGQTYELPQIALRAATTANIEVFSSPVEIAEEQVHAQEKQRVLGVIPNFYTSYVWDAVPLTPKQKFGLAIRSEIDPISFLGAAVGGGYEQWQNDFRGYGQGAQGFAKRFGASYVTGFNGAIIGNAILPSILHQDPRYFWKGTGTIRHRALYSVSTVVICKGDNGKWQTNYSNILGNLAAGGISNAYYPPGNRGVALTIDNALLGFAAEAIGNLVQEFVLRKISTGVQP